MRTFASEYSLECEIRLKFCEYSHINEYFEANIRQNEKCYGNIHSEANIRCNMYLFCIKLNICANLCAYFKANMKRTMRINGVCEYTETCE